MRKITIEQEWHQQSEAAKNEAQKLPHGRERDALIREGPAVRNGLPNQSMAFVGGAEAARIGRST